MNVWQATQFWLTENCSNPDMEINSANVFRNRRPITAMARRVLRGGRIGEAEASLASGPASGWKKPGIEGGRDDAPLRLIAVNEVVN